MLLQNYKYAKFSGYFETRKQSFISAFSICMAVPLNGWSDSTGAAPIGGLGEGGGL